ncbi:MAG TPA: hypothetical protein VNX68_11930 [Nitrosopumilaceae archaeon]|jgi:hypothetical protein|nr:hypothetical protein [Nitrosopumilaceae archaeon]
MKLNPMNVHPKNNTIHFAVRDSIWSSPVGLVLFLDGKWYLSPGKEEVGNKEDEKFLWIEIEK